MSAGRSESESYSSRLSEKRQLLRNGETDAYIVCRQKIAQMRGVSVLTPDFQNHIFTPAFE